MQKENLTANSNIRRKMMTFSFYELKSRNQALKKKKGAKKQIDNKRFLLDNFKHYSIAAFDF